MHNCGLGVIKFIMKHFRFYLIWSRPDNNNDTLQYPKNVSLSKVAALTSWSQYNLFITSLDLEMGRERFISNLQIKRM